MMQLVDIPVLANYMEVNRLVTQEYADLPMQLVEGAVPADLRGTLYRNGNGRFEHQGVKYEHLFDGDGMIAKFHFGAEGVSYSNRYVRTAEFEAEEAAGRMLYRSFGTNLPGGIPRNFLKMRFKNAANTSIIHHGGHWMALWEGGLPHRFDPETLETIDRFDYGGILQNNFSWLDRQITPELPFSAHPKVHPTTGVLHNFGTAAGTKQRLVIYEVDPQGEARIAQAIDMKEVTFAHDFLLTETGYRLFFLTPVAFNLRKAFLGSASPAASIRVDKSAKTQIVIVGADGSVHRLETDFGFVFHFANGYQDTDGTLVADGLMMDDFPDSGLMRDFLRGKVPTDYRQARFVRYRINLEKNQVDRQLIGEYEGELPEIHPDRQGLPYRYVWSIGRPPGHPIPLLDHIVRVDVETGEGKHAYAPDTLPSEPVVVPRQGAAQEDDAYLLYLRYHAPTETTDLIVSDAATLEQQARFRLPHNIPLGFHGYWEASE